MTKSRLFWCCTHVTLRKTEIPVFLEHAIEIIPEEVFAAVLTPLEGKVYDDPSHHPVIEQWQNECTLDAQVLNVVRRARLSQRKGRISPEEQAYFNNYFDIIYIATDLDTAVEVASWFKGDVVFRYFGFHNNLRPLDVLTHKHEPADLQNLIYCPIFQSLQEVKGASLFERSVVVHGYISEQIFGHKWAGWEDQQSAAVAAHNIGGDATTDATEAVRSLIPLARQINIDLFGKNTLDSMPPDIVSNFDVTGTLPAETYLERFLASRVLIHPFSNRYHNHYTNIEACFAGMPVLLLQDNPLFNENVLAGTTFESPEEFGVFKNIDRLINQSKYLFSRKELLQEIALRQRDLLAPFSRENVTQQIAALLNLCTSSRNEAVLPALVTPFSQTPCNDIYFQNEILATSKAEIPFGALLHNVQLQLITSNQNGQPCVQLREQDGPLTLIVPLSEKKFSGNMGHKIAINGTGEHAGLFSITAEIWAQDALQTSNTAFCVLDESGQTEFELSFDLTCPVDFSIVLHISVQGGAKTVLQSISHQIENTKSSAEAAIFSKSSLSESLKNADRIPASLFVTQQSDSRSASTSQSGLGVPFNSEFTMLKLAPAGHPLNCSRYDLEITVSLTNPESLEICLESWEDGGGIVHRFTQSYPLGSDQHKLRIPVGNWEMTPIIPILFIKSQRTGNAILCDVRIIAEHARVSQPVPQHTASQNETPAIAHRYYGQFNPPVDQFLFENYFKDRKTPGYFIECGACDGVTDSSCLFFKETLGWTGMNIEASRYLFRSLEANRPGELNIFAALSNERGTATFRNAIHPDLGRRFGNGSLNHAPHHLQELLDKNCTFEEYEVETFPLGGLLEAHSVTNVDLMVLDVEGHELSVLEGMKNSKVLPAIICAEHGQLGLDAFRQPMADLGYRYDAQSHVNSVWIRS